MKTLKQHLKECLEQAPLLQVGPCVTLDHISSYLNTVPVPAPPTRENLTGWTVESDGVYKNGKMIFAVKDQFHIWVESSNVAEKLGHLVLSGVDSDLIFGMYDETSKTWRRTDD